MSRSLMKKRADDGIGQRRTKTIKCDVRSWRDRTEPNGKVKLCKLYDDKVEEAERKMD